MLRPALLSLALLLPGLPAPAQEAVFLIRHGEKEATGEDPGLTDAGQARAAAWARMLAGAGLSAVFTSDARRTRETGSIIAKALDLPLTDWPLGDSAGLVDLLQFDHEADRVLIVGHVETIPGIAAALGAEGEVTLTQEEFDRLTIVSGGEAPRLIALRMP